VSAHQLLVPSGLDLAPLHCIAWALRWWWPWWSWTSGGGGGRPNRRARESRRYRLALASIAESTRRASAAAYLWITPSTGGLSHGAAYWGELGRQRGVVGRIWQWIVACGFIVCFFGRWTRANFSSVDKGSRTYQPTNQPSPLDN
jgi:hypothetical protein